MVQYAHQDFPAIMQRIADAVEEKLKVAGRDDVTTAQTENGFTFTQGNKVVTLFDDPNMNGRLGINAGTSMVTPVDLNHQFGDDVIDHAATAILSRFDDGYLWMN